MRLFLILYVIVGFIFNILNVFENFVEFEIEVIFFCGLDER